MLRNKFLSDQNRKLVVVRSDGNCFYSALSVQLFGTPDKDGEVRNVVSRMILLNKSDFLPIFIPRATAKTFEEHCKQVWMPGTWATQVEVVAAATVFNVPIYFMVQSGEFKWNVIKPLKRPHLRHPDIPEVDVMLLKPNHFELFYYENTHYDAIVSAHTAKVCIDYPVIPCIDSELICLSDSD